MRPQPEPDGMGYVTDDHVRHVNIPEARKTLEIARMEQDHVIRAKMRGSALDEDLKGFDMGHWVQQIKVPERNAKGQIKAWKCATSACLAGWAVQNDPDSKVIFNRTDGDVTDTCEVKGRGKELIEHRAAHLLGLPQGLAGHLFYTDSNEEALDRLEWIIGYAENVQAAEDLEKLGEKGLTIT